MRPRAIHALFPKGRYKALTFSYDDGREEDRRLVSIFRKHGLKATFNLNSGEVETDPRLHLGDEAEHDGRCGDHRTYIRQI